MNIRYSQAVVDACAKAGLRLASFDRSLEPTDVKEKEGGTLEWGTRRAIEDAKKIPDCVYDEGEKGKEPMIRVLGKNPAEVVRKVREIFNAWQGAGV
jgi:hydroxymethylpyrimidine/phosphomethylpyrimidine kinase